MTVSGGSKSEDDWLCSLNPSSRVTLIRVSKEQRGPISLEMIVGPASMGCKGICKTEKANPRKPAEPLAKMANGV